MKHATYYRRHHEVSFITVLLSILSSRTTLTLQPHFNVPISKAPKCLFVSNAGWPAAAGVFLPPCEKDSASLERHSHVFDIKKTLGIGVHAAWQIQQEFEGRCRTALLMGDPFTAVTISQTFQQGGTHKE